MPNVSRFARGAAPVLAISVVSACAALSAHSRRVLVAYTCRGIIVDEMKIRSNRTGAMKANSTNRPKPSSP